MALNSTVSINRYFCEWTTLFNLSNHSKSVDVPIFMLSGFFNFPLLPLHNSEKHENATTNTLTLMPIPLTRLINIITCFSTLHIAHDDGNDVKRRRSTRVNLTKIFMLISVWLCARPVPVCKCQCVCVGTIIQGYRRLTSSILRIFYHHAIYPIGEHMLHTLHIYGT